MKYVYTFLLLAMLMSCDTTSSTTTSPKSVATDTSTAGAETVNPQEYELSSIVGSNWQLAEKTDETGEIIVSGFLDAQGRKQGSWSTWKGSRSPSEVIHYLNGKRNGLYQEMDAVGRVRKVCFYLDGQLHGRYAEYRAGIVQKSAAYKNGQLHGTYREHTLQNGNVNRSIEYKNGQPDGPMRWFNDNGELIQERMYTKGELIE